MCLVSLLVTGICREHGLSKSHHLGAAGPQVRVQVQVHLIFIFISLDSEEIRSLDVELLLAGLLFYI